MAQGPDHLPPTSEGQARDILRWLGENRCTVRACFRRYDHDRFNVPVGEARVAIGALGQEVEAMGSRWRVEGTAARPAGTPEAADLAVTFICLAGELPQTSLSVELEIAGWSEANYVLLPAAAYNGNRFLSRRIPYSPKLYYVQDIGPDKPTIITDVPRLSDVPGPSRIQERSGSLATPALGFRSDKTGTGLWMLTAQGNDHGDYGLGVEENRARDRAVFSITSPVVRELYNYRICDLQAPSLDRPADFRAGDRVTIVLRVHAFPCPDVQALFDRFARVRKDFAAPQPPPRQLPYRACLECLEEKFNRENFVPRHGYYSVGPRTNFLQDWQIGWTGGMISTYPLLAAGGEETRRNVLRNFDWLFPDGISPSGFFWDSGQDGTKWIGGDIRKPHTGHWHLIRKSGDAVFYIVKQFRLMEQLGLAVKPAWSAGLRSVCDAIERLWRRAGQFGQFVDSRTGAICVGGSTSGGILPAALALAADYYQNPAYLEVAKQSAEHFYQNFTRAGLHSGGPGDACQNPDSESCYALVESYITLHEATGEAAWLARAGEQARQFATWVVSYDFDFPPASTFGRAAIRTTGAVYANTQNKHAAPGLCTYSGLGLLKLFRATGERFYLDLLHDIARRLPQYLPHALQPLGEAALGHICERVNLTDWEGPERIGETLLMSTWAETALMLTAVELPGLYVRPEASLAVAFDNVEANILADTPLELAVELANPTRAAADVSILAESESAARLPLPFHATVGPRVRRQHLPPGQRVTLSFTKQPGPLIGEQA